MIKPNIILIGAGGHANACIDVIELEGIYNIAGLVGQKEELGIKKSHYKVIATDQDLDELYKKYDYALVAIGQIKSAGIRITLHQKLKHIGYKLPVVISPRSYVSSRATVGEGTIVMHDALINAGASIGVNCIVNTKALIEHDALIGDHCHISTGAIVNGRTVIGDETFIGSNSIITNNIKINSQQFIRAGSTNLKITHDESDT